MKRTTVLNLRNVKSATLIKDNFPIILLTILFTIGVLIGTTVVFSSAKGNTISASLFNGFLSSREGNSFFGIFVYEFLFSFVFLFIIYFCGTSLFGLITSPIIIFIRGIYFGLLISYMYSKFALKGIVFNAFLLIPGASVSTVIIMVAVIESITFSSSISKMMLPVGQTVCNENMFKNYCIKFSVYLLILVFPSLLNAVLSVSLFNYFSL